MKKLFLTFSFVIILSFSSCSSLSKIKEETYSEYSEITPISKKRVYTFENFPVIDTTKLHPKYKAEIILFASIWKQIKPSYRPKNDEWKYGYVEINIEDEENVNFVLKNSTGKILDKKNHRYVSKNNFIELDKQVIAAPLYIVLWTLGSQRLALGLKSQNDLIILKQQGSFAMLLFVPTFGGGFFEDNEFKTHK